MSKPYGRARYGDKYGGRVLKHKLWDWLLLGRVNRKRFNLGPFNRANFRVETDQKISFRLFHKLLLVQDFKVNYFL